MRKELDLNNKGAINIEELMEYLSVGKNTANKIGIESGAVFFVGRRKLYSVKKIQEYIDKKVNA